LLAQIAVPALEQDREKAQLSTLNQQLSTLRKNAIGKAVYLRHLFLRMNAAPEISPPRGRGVIARYRNFLPVTGSTPIVSLGEGGTPLIFSPRLSAIAGRGCEVHLKYEGLNPTCSFKDRGMTVAVSKAAERKVSALICASTGNTSASAAAYAARAGLRCVVVLPAGKIASGKLLQAFAYGAKVIAIDGNFDDALLIVRKLGERKDFAIVNSINPDRIAGQKTAAFEIVDELGGAPDFHLLPLGNAGNLTAYWAGYREYQDAGKSNTLPAMIGFQAAGAAPIFHGRVVEKPETIASAIRIGNPASWKAASQAVADSSGAVDIVTDEEILAAQQWLATNEGIFVEPASAAPIAGLFKCCEQKRNPAYSFAQIPEGSRIVCTVTGHGLKNPEAMSARTSVLKTVAANESAVLDAIGF
jgi:threonine synthase